MMKRHAARLFWIGAGILLVTSCSSRDGSPVKPGGDARGQVVVQVYFDDQGIPDKRVELVELGLLRTTNGDGLVRFVVPAGEYTVRAYEINRGGPVLLYVDVKTKVTPGERSRLRIFDCLPCV
jgi:hypothetical protein